MVLVAGAIPAPPYELGALASLRWPYPLTSSAAREREGGGSELQLSRHHRKFASQFKWPTRSRDNVHTLENRQIESDLQN